MWNIVKEFDDNGTQLKVIPISPFRISTFSLIHQDLHNSSLICAFVKVPSPFKSTIVIFNSTKMKEEFVIRVQNIRDVFCFENGGAAYLLVSTRSNELFCFDIETRVNLFSLTFEDSIDNVVLQPY